jgi:hypothetical protein
VSSGRSFYFAAFLLAATWSSSVLYMTAAASDFAYSLDLSNAIAQNYSSGYGYGQNSGSQDLLPPSLGGGAKVQPTVTPPSASEPGQNYGNRNGSNGGYGNNGSGRGNGGHHHHHHGHNGGSGYSSNMGGGGGQGGSYGRGRWNNSGSSSSSPSSGGPVITIWNSPKSGAGSESLTKQGQAHSVSSAAASIRPPAATSSATTSSTPPELQAAADQTHEMEQKFAQEASEQTQQIHARAAARRREISAQISANNQNNSINYGRHRGGNRGNGTRSNNNSNGANDYLRRELNQESTFEQKQVESIQKQYEAKERAIHDAADHLAAHYDVSGNSSVPRLGATRNDLHVQNYEINDTASGAEIPLVATPKSLH